MSFPPVHIEARVKIRRSLALRDPIAFYVFDVLSDHVSAVTCTAYPTHKQMADKIGLSNTAKIPAALCTLIDAGYIRIVAHYGKNRYQQYQATTYIINPDFIHFQNPDADLEQARKDWAAASTQYRPTDDETYSPDGEPLKPPRSNTSNQQSTTDDRTDHQTDDSTDNPTTQGFEEKGKNQQTTARKRSSRSKTAAASTNTKSTAYTSATAQNQARSAQTAQSAPPRSAPPPQANPTSNYPPINEIYQPFPEISREQIALDIYNTLAELDITGCWSMSNIRGLMQQNGDLAVSYAAKQTQKAARTSHVPSPGGLFRYYVQQRQLTPPPNYADHLAQEQRYALIIDNDAEDERIAALRAQQQPPPPPNDLFKAALAQLEIQIDRPQYETWMCDLTCLSHTTAPDGSHHFELQARHDHAAQMLTYRLYRNVHRVFKDVCSAEVTLTFTAKPKITYPEAEAIADTPPATPAASPLSTTWGGARGGVQPPAFLQRKHYEPAYRFGATTTGAANP